MLELSRRRGLDIRTELWDADPEVIEEWECYDCENAAHFHLGDGFLGAGSLLGEAGPALLHIDSPYIDAEDSNRAEDLICKAVDNGWVVLCWYIEGMKNVPSPDCDFEEFSLDFSEVGLECGRFRGAAMILAGASESVRSCLGRRVDSFLSCLGKTSESF